MKPRKIVSFDEMVRLQRKVIDVLAKNHWVEILRLGRGSIRRPKPGIRFCVLLGTTHIGRKSIRSSVNCSMEFAKIPGLMVFMQSPPLITLGQNEGRSQYSVALQDADFAELYKWAPVARSQAALHPRADEYL